MAGGELACYGGKFLTNVERVKLTPEELKTCLQLNLWKGHDESDGSALYIVAPTDEGIVPLGAKINSSMYGFEEWCTKEKSVREIEAEHRRRLSMINCRFTEHYDSRPLNNKHYVTITATKAFTGDKENPQELILGYEQGTDDNEIEDKLARVLADRSDDDGSDECEDEDEEFEPVRFVLFFFFFFCGFF